ncbi:MAG: efflux RND transporter periplasmic adaptor subunit [Hyphomicrobiales bacterium]
MSKRFFVFIFLLICAILGGLYWFQFMFLPNMIKEAISKSPPPVVTISAAPATTETWVPIIRAIGTLKAETGIDVTTQASGIVETLAFNSGDDVKEGALLVQLDDTVEQADLHAAQATLKNAESDLARQQDLFKRGTVAQSQLDQAIAKRDESAAAVDKIQAVIEQKRIVAPFAGKLGIRKIDKGQYISPGQALVPLQALDEILVDFPLPEQELSRVKIGQDVEMHVDAFPGTDFKGKIDAIDARVNQETRTVIVRARIDNADRRLLPGMFANLEVLAGAPEKVVTIPRTAVTYSLYGDSVYVVTPAPAQPAPAAKTSEGGSGSAAAATATPPAKPDEPLFQVERRFVKIGETRENRVSILDGVKDGEQVAVVGQLKLTNGAKVHVDNSNLPAAPETRPAQ